MKKTILKVAFVAACIAAIVFLLLPFLETTPPATTDLKSVQPQVDTSENPLATIAKRLSSLFGRKTREGNKINAPLANTSSANSPLQLASARHAAMPAQRTEATAQPASQAAATQTIAVPPADVQEEYGNATIQTDDGEWVLIRQTAPQNSTPGMHEVNVHDNPYDRYVKQERARRLRPAAQPQQEIPDSKWARLIQPFKNFFFMHPKETSKPSREAKAHSLAQDRALQLASARDRLSAAPRVPTVENTRIPLPNITLQQWESMTEEEREKARDRYAVEQFKEMLSGEHAADQAAKIAADAKYPNPKTEQQKQEKATYTQKLSDKAKAEIKQRLFADLEAKASQQEAVDELMGMGCKNTSLPTPPANDYCEAPGATTGTTPKEVIAQQKVLNAQQFFELTHYKVTAEPPITNVLSPTTRQTIEHIAENSSDSQMAEVFQFLYEYQNCEKETCYPVANANPRYPQMPDAVTMANGKPNPDPIGLYPTQEEPFVQHKLEQFKEQNPQATDDQLKQEEEKARKQFQEHTPSWVFYRVEHARQAYDENKTIFCGNDRVAYQLGQDIDSPNILGTRQSLVESNGPVEASHQMNESAAQDVNDANRTRQDVLRPLYVQGTADNLKQNIKAAMKGNAVLQEATQDLNSKANSGSK